MTNCEICKAKSTLHLCNSCQSTLRAALLELPQWVDWLADTALKRTCSGDGAKTPHGDSQPGLYEGDTEKGRPTRQGRARALLTTIRDSLTTTVRDVCEHRNVMVPFNGSSATCAQLCTYLAAHVATIATTGRAADTFRQVKSHRDTIERLINRPVPPKTCGPCPATVTDVETGKERVCGIALLAPESALHVKCPTCKTVHDVQNLRSLLINQTGYRRYSLADTYKIIQATLGDEETMPPRSTFYDWCAKARRAGRLKVKGYQRPSADPDDPNELTRIGVRRHSDDDEPVFLVADVRRILVQPRPDKRRKVKA